MKKTKLELTWIGKENRPRLEPRILIEDPSKSYHAPFRTGGNDIFDNRIIFGDNLLALKALEQEFAGKVKCIYIDPPYNTGSAFTHYDDGVEHSIWLSLMRERLSILWRLLDRTSGSLWVSIDDREMAYLKVLLDEICGRLNFIAANVWQKRYSRENREAIGDAHEYLLVYATDPVAFKEGRNLIPLQEKQKKQYSNPDNDPRGPWQSVSLLAQGYRPNQMYEIIAPNGRRHTPPPGNCWKIINSEYEKLVAENRVYFGRDGNGVPRRKEFLSKSKGLVPWTWWPHEDVGHTGESKIEANTLFGADISFGTPKPERLMKRVIEIATNPGDRVLDSFAGSGTTGAVAHKMGRRWIMVELGEHCHTHIIPRIKKVINGEDKGGISEPVNWKGGGGFRYYRIAPSLLEKDQFGNWVISKEYNPAMLAEAICKLEGFTYAPSDTVYWQHGHSTESDFIYVTTQTLTREQLQKLSDEVGPKRSLLIMCGAFRAKSLDEFQNLTVKKIPKAVLNSCEWGKDDYSLEVDNLPIKTPNEETAPDDRKPHSMKEKRTGAQTLLFNMAGEKEDA
ncbi:MAG: site-specific DNA-methyltransferase [Deltaproteobacteria bacterium]|nr:site-specific DNA-methyltransferase [Deltaproteobacteria bacterium]